MHAHTHVLRTLLPRVWGAHTAAPPPLPLHCMAAVPWVRNTASLPGLQIFN